MIHNNYFNIVDISQYNITSSTSERLTHTLALSTRTVLPNLRLFCWARVTLSVTLRASGDDDMAKANTAVYNFTRDHSWLQNVWQTKSAHWSTYQFGQFSVGADTKLIRLSGYFQTQVWWIHITVSSLMAKKCQSYIHGLPTVWHHGSAWPYILIILNIIYWLRCSRCRCWTFF